MNRLEERVRRLAEAMRSAPDDVTAQTALLHRVLVAELMAGMAPLRGCGAAGRRQVPRHGHDSALWRDHLAGMLRAVEPVAHALA